MAATLDTSTSQVQELPACSNHDRGGRTGPGSLQGSELRVRAWFGQAKQYTLVDTLEFAVKWMVHLCTPAVVTLAGAPPAQPRGSPCRSGDRGHEEAVP